MSRIVDALSSLPDRDRPPEGVREVWLPVPGAPLYAVSNYGRILSLPRPHKPGVHRGFEASICADLGGSDGSQPRMFARSDVGPKGSAVPRVVLHVFDRPAEEAERVLLGEGDPVMGRVCYLDNIEWSHDRRARGLRAVLGYVIDGATSKEACAASGIHSATLYSVLIPWAEDRGLRLGIGVKPDTGRRGIDQKWATQVWNMCGSILAGSNRRQGEALARATPWPA